VISRRTAVLGGLFLVVFTCILTWGLASGAYGWQPGGPGGLRSLERTAGFANLVRALGLIQGQYVSTPDMQSVNQAALQAAVGQLGDPYSAYLTPQEYQAVQGSSSGRYTGIGVEVEAAGANEGPVVTRVFPGGPAATTPYAAEAPGGTPGLRAGDRLVAVDGASVRGLNPTMVRLRIVGAAGTRVQVQVERPASAAGAAAGGGAATLLNFTLTRQSVDIQSVAWKSLPGGVGYLSIQMFNARTPVEVQAALDSLRAARATALVVDLRNNPGGVLDAAVEVSRYFLPGGVVAYLQPRRGKRQAFAVPAVRPLGMPYVVLCNRYTASAAELLAGAMQDDHSALLVGEQTFGKGVVQRVFPLAGGAGLKLTVARYQTPKGRDLGGAGLTPDLAVAFPDATAQAMGNPATDPQLAAAIGVLGQKAAA